MRFENFVGGTYLDGLASLEDCINWYPELVESAGGRNRYKYRRTPGLVVFTNASAPGLGTGFGSLATPIRGIFAGENRLFAVGGANFYEIFSDGTWTNRSALGGAVTIGNDSLPCDLAYNGNQVLIASAGKAWVDNGAGTVAANFTGGGQVSAVRVGYLDGYGWAQKGASATNTNSNQFFLSALSDFTTWDPLQFASKSAFPDNIAAIYADHEEMWLLGDEESTEVWANNQQVQPQFPFQRNPNAIINLGCRATFSVSRLGNGVAWLAGDQQRGGVIIVHAEGYRWRRISNHPLEKFMATLGQTAASSVAYTEILNGHEFYVISFGSATGGQITWAYDLTTGMWHKRGFFVNPSILGSKIAYQCWVNLGFLGSAYYGGGGFPTDGNIYTVSDLNLSDAGTPIHRIRQAPYIADREFMVFHHRLRVLMQTGFSGPATLNPALTWSDDGGQTFSVPLTLTIQPNNFLFPVEWGGAASGAGGLGVSPRGRIYNLTITDVVDCEIIDADIEISAGKY